jgi:hypothetical protein
MASCYNCKINLSESAGKQKATLTQAIYGPVNDVLNQYAYNNITYLVIYN